MNQYVRWYKWGLAALIVVVLILCQNHLELREIQDVAGISIDPASNGKYKFGLELAQTDKQNDFTIHSELLTVEATDLRDALTQAGLDNEYPVLLTHCGLVIVSPELLGRDMNTISEFLLTEWSGQSAAYVCVAQDCSAERILRRDENENLRAGLLSAQVGRASESGVCPTECILDICDRYLNGEAVSLPLLTLTEHGYRIAGSTTIGGEKYGS